MNDQKTIKHRLGNILGLRLEPEYYEKDKDECSEFFEKVFENIKEITIENATEKHIEGFCDIWNTCRNNVYEYIDVSINFLKELSHYKMPTLDEIKDRKEIARRYSILTNLMEQIAVRHSEAAKDIPYSIL